MSPRGAQSVMNQMIEDALEEAWPNTFTRRGTLFSADSGQGVQWYLEGETNRHAHKKGELEFTLAWGVEIPGLYEIMITEREFKPPKTKRVWTTPIFARAYDVTPLSSTECWWKATVDPNPPRPGLLSRLFNKTVPLPVAVGALREFLTSRMSTPEEVERFLLEDGYGKVAPEPLSEFVETIAALQILQGNREAASVSLDRLRGLAKDYDSAQIAHRVQILTEFLDGRRSVADAGG